MIEPPLYDSAVGLPLGEFDLQNLESESLEDILAQLKGESTAIEFLLKRDVPHLKAHHTQGVKLACFECFLISLRRFFDIKAVEMHLCDSGELPAAKESVEGHEHPGHSLLARPLHLLHVFVSLHDPLIENNTKDTPHQLGHILFYQSCFSLVLSLQS